MNDPTKRLRRARWRAVALGLGFHAAAAAQTVCDQTTVQGVWQLEGHGQNAESNDSCVGTARLEILPGNTARYSEIQVECQTQSLVPRGSSTEGTYFIKPTCLGQMNLGSVAYFVAVAGANELLMIQGYGNVTMSWTGARLRAAEVLP